MPFCTNCGNRHDDGARFCPSCGTALGAEQDVSACVNASEPQPQPTQAAPAKKNRTLLIVICTVLAFAVAFLIGKTIVSVAYKYVDSGADSPASTVEPTADANIAPAEDADIAPTESSMFNRLFAYYDITYTAADFSTLDSAAYVTEIADDDILYVDCMEFGYKNDLVYELVETVYYYVGVLTDSELEQLDAAMQESFAAIEAQPFVEITYSQYSTWYVVTMKVHDLNKAENVQAALNSGTLVGDEGISYISMSATKEELLSSGYYKK